MTCNDHLLQINFCLGWLLLLKVLVRIYMHMVTFGTSYPSQGTFFNFFISLFPIFALARWASTLTANLTCSGGVLEWDFDLLVAHHTRQQDMFTLCMCELAAGI